MRREKILNNTTVFWRNITTIYYHFMFDQHELIISNGAWTESFQLVDANIDTEQAQELVDIFENDFQGKGFTSARTVLKKHEAALI